MADVFPYSKAGDGGQTVRARRDSGQSQQSHLKRFKGCGLSERGDCGAATADGRGGAAVDGTVQAGRIVCIELVSRVLGLPSDADPRGMTLGGESGVCA